MRNVSGASIQGGPTSIVSLMESEVCEDDGIVLLNIICSSLIDSGLASFNISSGYSGCVPIPIFVIKIGERIDF